MLLLILTLILNLSYLIKRWYTELKQPKSALLYFQLITNGFWIGYTNIIIAQLIKQPTPALISQSALILIMGLLEMALGKLQTI